MKYKKLITAMTLTTLLASNFNAGVIYAAENIQHRQKMLIKILMYKKLKKQSNLNQLPIRIHKKRFKRSTPYLLIQLIQCLQILQLAKHYKKLVI